MHGNADKLGGKEANQFIEKDRFAVLEGTLNVQANGANSAKLDYPNGFTRENCILISNGIKVIDNKGYNYEGLFVDSSDALNNCYRRRVNLTNTVDLIVYNPNENAINVSYKLVLMRID